MKMKTRKEIEACVRYDRLEELSLMELVQAVENLSVQFYIEEGVRPNGGHARALNDMIDKVKSYIEKNYC